MNGLKSFKKGETLFKEGDRAQSIFLIQSGTVFLHFSRGKQKIDYYQAGNHMILGEYALSGQATHIATATANSEVKAIELPLDAVKGQVEAGTQISKAIFKGLVDKMKTLATDLKSAKLERDSSPCPPDQTAKIFGTIWHVANHKGEKNEKTGSRVTVDWHQLRTYAQRVFIESPKRLEQAISIFVKLKWAELQMVKNEEEPDEPEVLGFVHFSDLRLVEQFFEYYQYYHFKSGKQDLLKTDDTAMTLAWLLNKLGESIEADRQGLVRLEYQKVIEAANQELGLQLKSDHFNVLEMKGLFCKRHSTDTGVFLQFEKAEFKRVFEIWLVLREITKWNETGLIDPKDEWKPLKKNQSSGLSCPECSGPVDKDHRFCPSCGHKLAQTNVA